jgi:hypothetical protein
MMLNRLPCFRIGVDSDVSSNAVLKATFVKWRIVASGGELVTRSDGVAVSSDEFGYDGVRGLSESNHKMR